MVKGDTSGSPEEGKMTKDEFEAAISKHPEKAKLLEEKLSTATKKVQLNTSEGKTAAFSECLECAVPRISGQCLCALYSGGHSVIAVGWGKAPDSTRALASPPELPTGWSRSLTRLLAA